LVLATNFPSIQISTNPSDWLSMSIFFRSLAEKVKVTGPVSFPFVGFARVDGGAPPGYGLAAGGAAALGLAATALELEDGGGGEVVPDGREAPEAAGAPLEEPAGRKDDIFGCVSNRKKKKKSKTRKDERRSAVDSTP
jgi:hypothetical protein